MITVYVLRSLRDQSLYIGVTERDVMERLREHNLGRTLGNRNRIPFELVYQETYDSLELAVRRERFLKSGKGRRILTQLIANRQSGNESL